MEKLPQRDDIQGLRAVAVLAVVLFHVDKRWLPGGFTGVDIFLVISGFLITSIIARQRSEGSFSFVAFYASRVRRIVPAYLVMLAGVAACMAVLLTPQDFTTFWNSLRQALVFNSNNFFANHGDYFAPAAHELPLLHTWSLAVEMQFYLLLPAMITVIPRRFAAAALGTLAAAILVWSSIRLAHGARQAEYFSLLARIPEFLTGGLLALWPVGRRWSSRTSNVVAWAGLLLVLTGFFVISDESPFPGALALLPCLGAGLLIAAGPGSHCSRALSNPAMVWIGALSYSLYLWHWPILAGLRYFLETYRLPPGALAAFAALTLAVSYISYRYVELPFRRRGARRGRGLALVAGVLAVIGVAQAANPRLVDPLPPELTRYAIDAEICHGKQVGDCLRGNRESSREILLLGDSHGAQLNLFADVVGRATASRIRVLTGSSCVPIDGFDVERLPEWARPPCIAQIDLARKHLQGTDVVIVAGKWQYQVRSVAFMSALDRFLAAAAARSQRVIVLAQVPSLAADVMRTYRLEHLGIGGTGNGPNAEWKMANDRVRAVVEKHPNATFLDLSGDPLFANLPFEQGVLIYYDSHHLNEVGSRRYGEIASPHLARLIGPEVNAR